MTTQHKQLTEEEKQQNRKILFARTKVQLSHAMDTAQLIFEQGDLRPYVELLSRFHSYNFYNILLILSQCPNVTRIIPVFTQRNISGHPELVGQPVDLVFPYIIEQPPGTLSLTWITTEYYGIRPEDTDALPSHSYGHLSKEAHIEYLLTALCALYSEEYSLSVLYGYNDPLFAHADIVGYRESNCLYCRPNAPKVELLHWLCTMLLQLANAERVIGNRYKELFCDLAAEALLRIWGIWDSTLLRHCQDPDLVRTVPIQLRPIFLEYLSRKVRTIEEYIHCEYQTLLRPRTKASNAASSHP